MSNYKLLVGPDKLEIDTEEIKNISLNLSIKDINNFGKRNASFSKPITVLHTKNTDKIFKSLFNINSINGFDVTKKFYGELIEDGLTILKGSIQVTDITPDYYEIVIFDNFITLFADLSDKFIVGNIDASLDLQYDSNLFSHTLSRNLIQNQLRTTPALDGSGYIYPLIDYDGLLYDETTLTQLDYPLLPAIAAKQVFDKILTDNGYSYEMSSDILDVFKKIYIPLNDNFQNLATDWQYANMRLGSYQTVQDNKNIVFSRERWFEPYVPGFNEKYIYNAVLLPLDPSVSNQIKVYDASLSDVDLLFAGITKRKNIPMFAIKGLTISSGNYNNINPPTALINSDYENAYGFRIPEDGTYTFDLNAVVRQKIQGEGEFWWPYGVPYVDTLEYLYYGASFIKEIQNTEYSLIFPDLVESNYSFFTTDISANPDVSIGSYLTKYYLSGQVADVQLKKDMIGYVCTRPANFDSLSGTITADVLKTATLYEPSTYLVITRKEELINIDKTFNMTSMLPKQYKQVDFVNDIFKLFNSYVTIDEINNKKLYIKSYDNFFSNSLNIDWSDKIIEDSIKFKSYKNSAPKKYTFKLAKDEDYYNLDFFNWKNESLYTNTVVNDSEFASEEQEIELSFSPTALGSIGLDRNLPKIFDKDNQFKTDWNHRLLFFNSTDFSYKYGCIDDASSNVTKWNILSPKLYNDVSTNAATNIFLGFNSKYSYMWNITEETNRTLYNLYYKKELETTLDNEFKMLTCKVKLNAADIVNFNFNSLIRINNKNIGNGIYRINTIKNYNTNTNICNVELLKIII